MKTREEFMCEIPSTEIFCFTRPDLSDDEEKRRMSLVLTSRWYVVFVCSWKSLSRVRSTCFNNHGVTNRMLLFLPSSLADFPLFIHSTTNDTKPANNGKWNSQKFILSRSGSGPVALCGNSITVEQKGINYKSVSVLATLLHYLSLSHLPSHLKMI